MDNIMAQRIHDERIKHNLTLEELGEKLGVQSSAVSKWERGRVTNIKRSTIQKMADIFECSPVWLMGIDGVDDVGIKIITSKELEKMSTSQLIRLLTYASKILEMRENKKDET